MKRSLRLFTILIVAITLIMISTNVFAEILTPNNVIMDENVSVGGLTNTAGRVMALIRNAAVIAAVIIIMILGVKYMLGSVEEKAGYQKSFIPLIVGIIVVVAATQIATMIFNVAE